MSDNPYVYSVTAATFASSVIEASFESLVLVDFWAPWCGPCQALAPVLDRLAAAYQGRLLVAKVNADEEPQITAQARIQSLPTVLLLHQGQVVDQFMGAQPEGAIKALIDRHLPAPPPPQDTPKTQAEALIEAHQAPRAVALLRAALAKTPDDAELQLTLADALLHTGDVAEVQALLEGLPVNVREGDEAKSVAARLAFANAVKDAPDAQQLAARVEAHPDDLAARYQLAARHIIAGRAEAGLEQLLEIMRRDRQFQDDLGRRSLVAAFEIIDDPALIKRYRRQMSALLF
ncbi:MAG: thioredoxin [Candidatus Competibacterales bacterium]